MKLLLFTPYPLSIDRKIGEIEHINNDETLFYDLILQRHFDVLLISFEYYPFFLEIKNYFKGYTIFLTNECDNLSYKKILEVADYCYTYLEIYKLNIRLMYLRKRILKLNATVFRYKDFFFNFATNELYKNSEPIKLSQADVELLKALIKNRNKYLSKEEILEECDHIESGNSIKVLITHLRKIGFDIENKKNVGYRLKEI